MSDIQQYHFDNNNDKDRLKEIFAQLFHQGNFVPFFGSGFSKGLKAKGGKVPSVSELKNKLIDFLKYFSDYSTLEIKELNDMSLSEVSGYLFSELDTNNATARNVKKSIHEYIENYFVRVNDIPKPKENLICSGWKYIYTLNYDDTIERVLQQRDTEYYPIIPYCKLNFEWLPDHLCIFKIHGDAKTFISSGDFKYLIISQKQYATMLSDSDNADLRRLTETDFASCNLIFFGCSLVDEIDLLIAADFSIKQRAKNNNDIKAFYVNYVTNSKKSLSLLEQKKLKNFGITDIINVKEDEFDNFYEFISDISDSNKASNGKIDDFIGIKFVTCHDKKADIDFLFKDNIIVQNKAIMLPSFFVCRNVSSDVVDNIKCNIGMLHIIRGGYLSGKTFALLNVVKALNYNSVYFFHSGLIITEEWFNNILNRNNSIFVFDEDTLDYEQIKCLKDKIDILIENNIKIVIAINIGMGIYTKHFFDDYPEMENTIKIYFLSSQFTNRNDNNLEIKEFNSKVSELGLVPYRENYTILDYILKVDESSICQHRDILPKYDIISKHRRDKLLLKSLIILSTRSAINISEAIELGIYNELSHFARPDNDEKVNLVIQQEAVMDFEMHNSEHNSIRFVVGSKYWVFKCLSEFASNPTNYESIAKCYYDIVCDLQRSYLNSNDKKRNKLYHSKVKPFYFLDTIQFTFFSASENDKGSLILPMMIYEYLLPIFKDHYQFLHQKAKCLLRTSRASKSDIEKMKYLNDALQQISRAYELAEFSSKTNVEYSLFHMQVTKVLILINIWKNQSVNALQNSDSFNKLIWNYNLMLDNIRYMNNQEYEQDFDKREIKDIRWFITYLLENGSTVEKLLNNKQNSINNIINISFKKILK